MTTYITSSINAASGYAVNLQSDAYVVAHNVAVTSASGIAMFGAAVPGEQGGVEIFVYGSVFGRQAAIESRKENNRVTVASGGIIHSDAYGVDIGSYSATANRVDDAGSIYGGFTGVYIAGTDWSVHNSGLIQGG